MDTPYEFRLRPHRELTLDELTSWYAANLTSSRDLLPVIAGADTTADIYNYLTQNSLGKYLGMLASGGLGTYIGTQFATTTGEVDNQAVQDRTATGNLGTYVGSRFNTVDLSGAVLGQSMGQQFGSLGGYVGQQASGTNTQVINTGAGLGAYVGQQFGSLGSNMGGQISNLGTYVGGEFASLGGNLGSQVQSLGGYMGIQFGSSAAHTDTVVGNATDFLHGVIGGAQNIITGAVNDTIGLIKNPITSAVIAGAGLLGDAFKDALEWLVNEAFGSFEDLFGKRVDNLHRLMNADFASMDDIVSQLDYGVRGGSIVSMLESVLGGVFMIPPLIGGVGAAYAEPHVQKALQITRPATMSLTDLRDGWLRGVIDDNWVHDHLSRMGQNDDNIDAIKALWFDPAPPSDLVRFLVREVFNPQLRQSLALDSEYPDAADAEARKVGLSPETMRNYWAAHWNLPSPGQVYEMLHRGFVNADDVDQYLKVADFSPAWRRNLANISYNVPGRIDLRRMFTAGVIDEPRVLKGYKDLGYSDPDAAALTQFAKHQASGGVTELPRGVVLQGYREGSMDRASAIAALQQLHFIQPEAVFMLDLEDLKNAQELQTLNENVIEADLKAGVVNEAQAMAALSSIGVPARRAGLLVALWRSRHAAKAAALSVGEIQHAAREHLIPDQLAFQRFQALGYNQGDAQMLVALAHPQAPANAPPTLTLSHLFRGLREGLLTPPQLQERLTRRGYSPEDVRILIDLATPDLAAPEAAELTKAELIAAAKAKALPVDAVQRRLVAKGYTAQDVDVILETNKFTFSPTGQLVSYPRRDLTVAQDSKAFATGLIDEKEFRFRLGELAYADADIDLLVELATPAAPHA